MRFFFDSLFVNLKAAQLSANRAVKLPNQSGTLIATENVPFGTALSFTGITKYDSIVISGPLNFTVLGAYSVPGARALLSLQSNGIDVPTFSSNFVRTGLSKPWVSRAGLINCVECLYDGSTYWYTIWQDSVSLELSEPKLFSFVAGGVMPTVTVPHGVTKMDVTLVGGGGGGGGGGKAVSGVAVYGGGGGGGGGVTFARFVLAELGLAPGSQLTGQIGFGGVGGNGTAVAGSGSPGATGGISILTKSSGNLVLAIAPAGVGAGGGSTANGNGGPGGTLCTYGGTPGSNSSITVITTNTQNSPQAAGGGSAGGGISAANVPVTAGAPGRGYAIAGNFVILSPSAASTTGPSLFAGNATQAVPGAVIPGNGGTGSGASTFSDSAFGASGFRGGGGGGSGAVRTGVSNAGGNGGSGSIQITFY